MVKDLVINSLDGKEKSFHHLIKSTFHIFILLMRKPRAMRAQCYMAPQGHRAYL